MGLDTSDEWIVERTGIRERRVGGTTAGLSAEAGRRRSACPGSTRPIDALVLATTTPDRTVPATSATVQHELGLRCGAFDVNAACSGFTYALVAAHGLIAMGAERILVIGTDTLARITDWEDRNTAILFADGSGAVVLEAVDGGGQLLGWDLDADGSAERFLYAEVGDYIQMDGKEVFRRAVRIMVDSAQKSMAHAGVTADDIALDRARTRRTPGSSTAACDRLGIGMDRAVGRARPHRQHVVGVDPARPRRRASTTGGSHDGDLVLLVGFGAGMTAASAVIRWGGDVGMTTTRGGDRPRHRRGPRHRPRRRPALRRRRRPGRGDVPLVGPARRAVRRQVRRDVAGDVDAAFAAVEEQFGGPVEVLVSNAGVTQRRAAAADERGRLHERARHQPHRRLPRRQAGRAGDAAGPHGAGSSSSRRSSACSARPARPTTPRPRPASSASPARWPASSARGASPSTSWPRARSRPT